MRVELGLGLVLRVDAFKPFRLSPPKKLPLFFVNFQLRDGTTRGMWASSSLPLFPSLPRPPPFGTKSFHVFPSNSRDSLNSPHNHDHLEHAWQEMIMEQSCGCGPDITRQTRGASLADSACNPKLAQSLLTARHSKPFQPCWSWSRTWAQAIAPRTARSATHQWS